MNLKVGIHIRSILLKDPEERFWYVVASNGIDIKYLWKNGSWENYCWNPRDDFVDLFGGHYASLEEALEVLKKYTGFLFYYDQEGEVQDVRGRGS